MLELYDRIKAVKTILPAKLSSDTNGTSVDLQGYESAFVVFEVGQSGDTLGASTYFTLKVQHSDDGSTWSDVPNASLDGGDNGIVVDSDTEDEMLYVRGYRGTNRYIRAIVDFTGTHTNGTPISAIVVLGDARHLPISY